MKRTFFISLIIFCSNFVFAQENPIRIFYEKSETGLLFYAENKDVVPYTVKIDFKKLENLSLTSGDNSILTTVAAGVAKAKLGELKKSNDNSSSAFDFSYLYTIGDASLEVEENYPYLLPYKHGKRVRVGQGNNGAGTHTGINAIDFNLEIGDSIYAARSGIVIEVKEDSNIGGDAPKFEPYGNFVKVYHDDGTLGSYVHLKKKGSLVKKGDQISKGQLIALSGNTGWSSGPHLHFMVSQNRNFKNFTLPVKFLNYEEDLFIPLESKSYYAYHPGKPSFAVKDKFKEAEFEGKMQSSNLENKIEFESEEYGDYILIYVNNGMKREVNGVLKLQLKNLISTKKLPHKFTAPAKSKMYLLALKPDDSGSSFGYQLSGEFK